MLYFSVSEKDAKLLQELSLTLSAQVETYSTERMLKEGISEGLVTSGGGKRRTYYIITRQSAFDCIQSTPVTGEETCQVKGIRQDSDCSLLHEIKRHWTTWYIRDDRCRKRE